jgi:hypothetical protein
MKISKILGKTPKDLRPCQLVARHFGCFWRHLRRRLFARYWAGFDGVAGLGSGKTPEATSTWWCPRKPMERWCSGLAAAMESIPRGKRWKGSVRGKRVYAPDSGGLKWKFPFSRCL